MKFYALKFGLSASSNQASLMDQLRSGGASVIQTSDGLCVKTEKSKAEIQSMVSSGVEVEELNTKAVLNDSSVAADVRAFIEGS